MVDERLRCRSSRSGSFASVIGGAPAAVLFTRDVDNRTGNDQRVKELEALTGAGDFVNPRRPVPGTRGGFSA